MQRFYEKTVLRPSGCIEWIAAKYPNGYGCFKIEGRTQGAHRIAWKLANGEIPKGLLICHRCDNRLCVNVDHLFLGDGKDNMKDCRDKGRLVLPTIRKLPEDHGTSYSYRRGCRCTSCKNAYKIVRRRHYLATKN